MFGNKLIVEEVRNTVCMIAVSILLYAACHSVLAGSCVVSVVPGSIALCS